MKLSYEEIMVKGRNPMHVRLQLSERGRAAHGRLSDLFIKPKPLDLINAAGFLAKDLKINLTIAEGRCFAKLKPEDINDTLTRLEIDIYHTRDIMVGLMDRLDGILIGDGKKTLEIPLRDLVALTRGFKISVDRVKYLQQKAKALFGFYSLREAIFALEEATFTFRGRTLSAKTFCDFGPDLFIEMEAFASEKGANIGDIEAAFLLLSSEGRFEAGETYDLLEEVGQLI